MTRVASLLDAFFKANQMSTSGTTNTMTGGIGMTSETTKQRQVQHLAQQLGMLNQRAQQLASLTVTTAEQVSYMRLLAAHHAGWQVLFRMRLYREKGANNERWDCRFMSAGSVMVSGEGDDATTTVQQ